MHIHLFCSYGCFSASTSEASKYSKEDHEKIIKLQALQRGKQVRKSIQKQDKPKVVTLNGCEYTEEDAAKIVKLQALQRGRRQRKRAYNIESFDRVCLSF